MQQGPDNLLTGTFSRTKPNYYFDNKIIHEPAKDWGAKRRRFLFFSSFDVSSVLKFCTWDTIVCPVFDLSQWGLTGVIFLYFPLKCYKFVLNSDRILLNLLQLASLKPNVLV